MPLQVQRWRDTGGGAASARGQCHLEGHGGGAGAAELGQDVLEIEREGEEYPGLTLFPPSTFLPLSVTH